MGHMITGLIVDIGQIDLTLLEMVGCWTLRIGGVTDTGITLVLVLIDIMIIIIIVCIRGMIGDTFRMSSRRQSHLPMMER